MNENKEINTRVNPTVNTAITTLIQLANAGYGKAVEILERMNVEKEAVFCETDPDDMINRSSDIAREFRYVVMNTAIEESGCATIMDLPCGYTPRVFHFIDKGMKYMGCDLPVVIEEFAPVIESMASEEQKSKISFSVVDVTNYESMKAAARKVEGPVCIVTEGLTVYLTTEETNQFRNNVYSILSEKGGCWITTDVETPEYYLAVFKAIAKDKAIDMFRALQRGFGGQSDTDFDTANAAVFSGKTDDGLYKIDYDLIEKYFRKCGFNVEKIPYYREDMKLRLYDKMSQEEIERLRENSRSVNLWKMTVNHDFKPAAAWSTQSGELENLPFEVRSSLKDGVFDVVIQGRMDTLTAPEVLRQFNEAGSDIKAIHIDVSRMAYVSSAGLRTFLIMYKKLENKDGFVMTGVSKGVREIMETTGFDNILL